LGDWGDRGSVGVGVGVLPRRHVKLTTTEKQSCLQKTEKQLNMVPH
jgi:hypothetical protein